MKININSNVLNAMLDYIGDILPSKPAMAICGGIFLEAKGNVINMIATDLENTIKVSCEGISINEEGNTVIPGKQFISLIKQFKNEEIKIEKKEKTINVISENSQYSFNEMEIEDFPKFPKFSSEINFKVKGETLKNGFRKIVFCIDPEEPRHQFRGGLLDIKERNINLVGTDTRRLSLFSVLYQDSFQKKIKVLLPYNLIKKMINLLNEEEIEISIGKNNISFQISFQKNIEKSKQINGNIIFVSQLLSGAEEFPDYEKVIPDIKKSRISKINTDLFLNSLKRISLFTTERNNRVKLSFRKNSLILSTSGELGEAQERINVLYEEEDLDISFPPEFLVDFLEVIDKEEFIFAFTASSKPVLMKEEEFSNFLYVCMPLKSE